MSDVPESIATTVDIVQPVVESSGSIWGYVVGGVAALVVLGFLGYKKLNKPAFIINQMRKRNMKEIKKMGAENSEAALDLDRLLGSVQAYAEEKGMKGTEVVKILAPMNDKKRIKTARDMYHSMVYIATEVNDAALVREFKNKAKQVKASSALMAGLFKRAGI
ncbi:hypothetical protein [Thaumasiovibrio sp. DFM-14]|uniref:hypothetical protein n=1 Tax=Thaumasiovibrio sp. DFM-14 TaxID=3384792 RepID=UPI00399FE4E9